MDTGDWRYGRGNDGAPWTEPSTGSTPTPDLWADEEADTSGWTSTSSWRPRHQADLTESSPISPSPISPSPIGPSPIGPAPTSPPVTRNDSHGSGIGSPVTGFPSGGYPIPGFGSGYAAAHPVPRYGGPGPATSEPSTHGGASFGGATYADESTYASTPSSGAAYGASRGTAPASGAGSSAYGTAQSFGTSSAFGRSTPLGPETRRPARASRLGPSGRRESDGEESTSGASYARVFGFTAIWYAAPLVLYLLWLVITAGDREAVAGRAFVDAIPWMLGAGVVSAGLAVLLRRITVGWGTVGVSFAAAVIGAGLATIVHSFA